MTTSTAPLLLVPSPRRPTDIRVRLPASRVNLFERIIRDPTVPNRPARERLCSEMLCAILMNAPTVRGIILASMAELAGVDSAEFADLDWEFDTERAVGAKRDDLRIEAWTRDDEPSLIVLWTIEVKVAAPLHLSSNQYVDDEPVSSNEPVEAELVQVSQLVNYDRWLSRQPATYRAGFLLSVPNLSAVLPKELQMPWYATTWTTIAQHIEAALGDATLPPAEHMLAEHFVGFIRDHLWSELDMADERLEFDDIAFLRALGSMGPDCLRKTVRLVSLLTDVVQQLDVPFVNVSHQKNLGGSLTRTVVAAKFLAEGPKKPVSPMLYTGIVGGEVRLWLESSPQSPAKKLFANLSQRFIGPLRERNADWVADSEPAAWPDLVLSKRLDFLLTADDQEVALKEFVASAIEDLRVSGAAAELRSIVEQLKAG